MNNEDLVRELVQRANNFRTDLSNPHRIEAWAETLETLADQLMPWAEEEDREAKQSNEHGEGQFMREWDDRPVAIVKGEDGEVVIVPTARDCRIAQRILNGLMDRQGLLVKRQTISGPARKVFQKQAAVQPKEEILEFESVLEFEEVKPKAKRSK